MDFIVLAYIVMAHIVYTVMAYIVYIVMAYIVYIVMAYIGTASNAAWLPHRHAAS